MIDMEELEYFLKRIREVADHPDELGQEEWNKLSEIAIVALKITARKESDG